MCRSIKTLREPFTSDVTEDEVRAAALQYVRKVSGFRAPAATGLAATGRAETMPAETAPRSIDQGTDLLGDEPHETLYIRLIDRGLKDHGVGTRVGPPAYALGHRLGIAADAGIFHAIAPLLFREPLGGSGPGGCRDEHHDPMVV